MSPLNYPIRDNFRLTEIQKKALKRVGLETAHDLLFYFPARYSDMSELKQIKDLTGGDTATIFAKVISARTKKSFRSRVPMARPNDWRRPVGRGEATLSDLSGSIKAVWFNQPYIAKMIHVGESLKLTGKISSGKNGLSIINPEYEKIEELPIGGKRSDLFEFSTKDSPSGTNKGESLRYPIYPETRGLSSKWIYHAIQKIISARGGSAFGGKGNILDSLEDYIPSEILKKYNLPTLRTALIWIHMPKREEDATAARKRFAFEEIFFIQLERAHDKLEYAKNNAFAIKIDDKEIENFTSRFSFLPTNAQNKAVKDILNDIGKSAPMARLLEGDVGSGKTLVAAVAAYAAIKTRPMDSKGVRQDFGNLQTAYMAPTEILASQHFESFIQYFSPRHGGASINIGLITGSGCRKFPSKVPSKIMGASHSEALAKEWTDISRAQLLKWVANGEIPILLGTHALIQKTVKFKNLALVVIDEQHRFGVNQRMKLAKKGGLVPHFLSMTATPIPRTLALTIYGDLDLTLLDEMPAGRKQVITEIVTPAKRDDTYQIIKKELEAGRQMYVICPRIFEPDPTKELAVNAKAATTEAKRLKKEVFPEYEIGVVHSKLTKQKKEEVMKDFTNGQTQILCATSVIEVGVNVPNATIIIIEGAERFGLAQLHQLRGRVIRSNHQAYCYVFAETKSEKTVDRLKALKTAKNGFELSELDLALRGSGELSGGKQWGISDLAMEAIKNIKMVEAARTEAQAMIKNDPELDHFPALKQKIKSKLSEFHFE